MVRKASERWVETRRLLAKPQYRYAEVETALAAVFGADAEAQAGVLRGRIKHFRKLGLPKLDVGKGARVRYSYEQVAQWLIALFLNDIGIEPRSIVQLFEKYWTDFLLSAVVQATDKEARADNPILLTVRPQQMLRQWGKREVAFFGRYRRFDRHFKQYPSRENIGMALDHPEDGAITIFNLTHALLKLEGAGIKAPENVSP
jgi:hypothetical protein